VLRIIGENVAASVAGSAGSAGNADEAARPAGAVPPVRGNLRRVSAPARN
jgi:hypothetical protein